MNRFLLSCGTAVLSFTFQGLAQGQESPRQKILIFKAHAPDHSPLHQKLKKSGRKFRRLKQSGLLLVQSQSLSHETELKSDPDLHFVEEDKKWYPASSGFAQNDPTHDYWVNDFFEDEFNINSNIETSESTILGIVDSGLQYRHEFFANSLLVNSREANGRAGEDDDGNGFVDDIYGADVLAKNGRVDSYGADHGTHVASLAKLSIDAASMGGSVKILPVNFMGDGYYGTTTSALVAIDYAVARGAKVLNLSWGNSGPGAFSQALYESFLELYRKDILLVAAAGNETTNNDETPFFPSSFNLPNLVSVASVTATYSQAQTFQGYFLSFFSNFGRSSVDVAAPGDLEISGMSIGLLGANGNSNFEYSPYLRKQGTSMAAPVVSGVAAVMRALNPSLKAHEVKDILISTSDTRPELFEMLKSGGFLNPQSAYTVAQETAGGSRQPSVPANPVRAAKDDDSGNRARIAGCAQIGTIGGGPPEGPLSGNSLILLSLIYFMMRLLRVGNSLLRKRETCV